MAESDMRSVLRQLDDNWSEDETGELLALAPAHVIEDKGMLRYKEFIQWIFGKTTAPAASYDKTVTRAMDASTEPQCDLVTGISKLQERTHNLLDADVLQTSFEVIDSLHEDLKKLECATKLVANAQDESREAFRAVTDELVLLKSFRDLAELVDNSFRSWGAMAWLKINLDYFDVECRNFLAQLCEMSEGKQKWQAYRITADRVKDRLLSIRLMDRLLSNTMREHHWDAFSKIVAKRIAPEPGLTCQTLFDLPLAEHYEAINDIVDRSCREAKITKKLRHVEKRMSREDMQLSYHDEHLAHLCEALSMDDYLRTCSDTKEVASLRSRVDALVQQLERQKRAHDRVHTLRLRYNNLCRAGLCSPPSCDLMQFFTDAPLLSGFIDSDLLRAALNFNDPAEQDSLDRMAQELDRCDALVLEKLRQSTPEEKPLDPRELRPLFELELKVREQALELNLSEPLGQQLAIVTWARGSLRSIGHGLGLFLQRLPSLHQVVLEDCEDEDMLSLRGGLGDARLPVQVFKLEPGFCFGQRESLGASAFECMGWVLRACPGLRALDLSKNVQLLEARLGSFLEGLGEMTKMPHLETLRLADCRLKATSCKGLGQLLARAPKVTHVDISDSFSYHFLGYTGILSEDGLREFAAGLDGQPLAHLQELRLGQLNPSERNAAIFTNLGRFLAGCCPKLPDLGPPIWTDEEKEACCLGFQEMFDAIPTLVVTLKGQRLGGVLAVTCLSLSGEILVSLELDAEARLSILVERLCCCLAVSSWKLRVLLADSSKLVFDGDLQNDASLADLL